MKTTNDIFNNLVKRQLVTFECNCGYNTKDMVDLTLHLKTCNEKGFYIIVEHDDNDKK